MCQTEEHSAVSGEFDVYRLQFCDGKVSAVDTESAMSSFTDVYEGPSTSHLVTNLQHNVQYSVRVSGRCCSESTSWSPWSLPVTWSTSLPRRGIYSCLSACLCVAVCPASLTAYTVT